MALPSSITQARTEAELATRTAGEFGAALPSIGDTLKKQVNDLYNENQDVLGSFAQGVGNLVAAPNQANEMFGGVRDPFARQGLISQFTGDQSVAPITYAGLLGQRMGRIGDVVQAGTNAFESETTARTNAAQLAQQRYEQLLNEFQLTENIRLQEAQAAATRALADASLTGGNQGGGTGGGTPANAGNIFTDILDEVNLTNKNPTEYHVWKYIKDNEAKFRQLGVDTNQLYSLHKNLKSQFGTLPLNSDVSSIGSFLGGLPSVGSQGFATNVNLGNNISGINLRGL